MLRLSQTKAAIDQAHALEHSVSPVPDDDRDEVASNTSVAVSLRLSPSLTLIMSSLLELIRVPEEDLNASATTFYLFT